MEKEQIADLFMKGQDCSQVVLSHYADELGIPYDKANRLAAAFGGGSGIGETCGAVIGALMVIGMRYGHSGPDDMEHRDALIAKRSEFIDKWKAVRGSCMCRDLLEDDISTPEGFSRIIESGKLFSLCPEFVLEAIEILDGIVSEPEEAEID